ncbi:MAG TPA: DUF4340 domain-containing protein [Oceanospirillales bacterium]|nr:DUF4340 domain-containing protein [Oceanospirillales bacterium]
MQNNFKLLIAILLVLSVVSYFVINNNSSKQTTESPMLVPELQDMINKVDGIVISKNDKSIHLEKQDDSWRIAEVENFLADTNKVATLLLDLRKLTLKQMKTSNPENYGRLQLAEAGADAATRIVLKNASSQFADISIGKQAQKTQGTYVRKNAEKQSWLAEGVVNVNLDKNYWMITDILDVDRSRIKSVTFKPVATEAFSISKLTPNDTAFVLDNIPVNKRLKATADLNNYANGLQKLSIDSATQKQQIPEEKLVLTVVYQLFSGMTYQLDLFKDGDKHQLTLHLENADDSAEFDKKLQNWLFTIPSFKFDALNKKLTDLIEDIPAAEANTTVEKQD